MEFSREESKPSLLCNFTMQKDVFVTNIDSVKSKLELLGELNTKLHFPYFGFNWDSLQELLCDLHWIQEKNIIIVHKGLFLPPKDLEVYSTIAHDSEKYWLNYPDEHVLKFKFNSIIIGDENHKF